MADVPSYRGGGTKGQTGVEPNQDDKSGAYGKDVQTMKDIGSPHMQKWNSYDAGPDRGASVKSGGGKSGY